MNIDPARFEVVKNALICAAEEMKIVLARTAYSPLLKVAGDYSCGIFDVQGNMVAQGPDLPIHLGSMPDAVRAVVKAFPDVAPGDVFIHNDPYHGGSHLPDVNVVSPAFHGGTLLGFGCVRAHWPDIGSATPGSYGAVTEIYGEGLRLPPVRLYRDGKPDPGIEAVIFANVRTPNERLGDLRAQVAANTRAAARMSALAEKYGTAVLLAIMQEVLDYSERMMRAALRTLPDGTAEFTDVFDGDGVIAPGETTDETFTVKLRIDKRGDMHHRRLHRLRSCRPRPDERAADGDRIRRVLCVEDDCRSEKPDPAQFGLLASGHRHRAPGLCGECAASVAGGLRQSRDFPSRRRYGDGRNASCLAAHRDGGVAGHLGGDHLRRRRPAQSAIVTSVTSPSKAVSARAQ